MSALKERQNADIMKIIDALDVDGVEKRIAKCRMGKRLFFGIFSVVIVYFTILRIYEGYEVNLVYVAIPLILSGVFCRTEADLIKVKKVMIDTVNAGN